jgi:biotin transport system substrate-specific component
MLAKEATLISHFPLLKNASIVLGGSILMALLAQFKVSLWFSPIPISMQTFGVLLIGSLCTPRIALSSLMLYLFEGAIGLPVFAGGSAGIACLVGASAGYLWSWPFIAYGIAKLRSKNPLHHFIILCAGSFSILICGTLWLSFLIGWRSAIALGFTPFLLGNMIKISLVFITLQLTKGAGCIIKKR